MSSRGFVHLWACQIGKDEQLLRGLARIFGVDVYAGTGDHNPIFNLTGATMWSAPPMASSRRTYRDPRRWTDWLDNAKSRECFRLSSALHRRRALPWEMHVR